MSNDIYPSLPGLTYSVVRSVIAPPVTIITTPSQREYRARAATQPRYHYTLPYDLLRSDAAYGEMQTLVGFYNSHGGPFDTFLFNDPDDNTATAATFAIGDAVTANFQLLRPFGGFSESVIATHGPIQIYYNGTPLNMLQQGAAFDNVVWVGNTGMTVTPNTANDPVTGALDADTLADGSATTISALTQIVPIQDALDTSTYTAQVYVKQTAGGTSKTFHMLVVFQDGGVNAIYAANIDTDTGTILSVTAGITCTTTLVSGFYHVVMLVPNNGSGNTTVHFTIAPVYAAHGLTTPDVTQTGNAICYGAMLFLGATAVTFTSRYFTWDWTTGIVTISPSPAAASALTWTGMFYRRCRFTNGSMDVEKFMNNFWAMNNKQSVEFISVKA